MFGVTYPVTAGMDGPPWGSEEPPELGPDTIHRRTCPQLPASAWPPGLMALITPVLKDTPRPLLRHFIAFCSGPLRPGDITQQETSPGGILKTKPPTSLPLQVPAARGSLRLPHHLHQPVHWRYPYEIAHIVLIFGVNYSISSSQ